MDKASVVEIFDSLQGEGRYVGARQIFVRLAGCPLDCPYCDTDHSAKASFTVEGVEYNNPVTAAELAIAIKKAYNLKNYHSIAFTGGEPLLYAGFLKDMAELLRQDIKFFLETSGHEPALLLEAERYFDYLSVDLKGHLEPFGEHADKLLSAAGLINPDKIYIKMPLSKEDDAVVTTAAPLFKKYAIKSVWFQPVDNIWDMEQVRRWQDEFAANGVDTRFIPQIHKLMDIA